MRAPTAAAASSGGIALIVLAMFFISLNDMLIKLLASSYPLHQMVFIRSAIGIVFTSAILHLEGGFASYESKDRQRSSDWLSSRPLEIVVGPARLCEVGSWLARRARPMRPARRDADRS